jgi:hypothetical protein
VSYELSGPDLIDVKNPVVANKKQSFYITRTNHLILLRKLVKVKVPYV